jgi:type I restriction enzyme, S subunit
MKDNWKKVVISEIGEVVSGGTPSTEIEEFWDGEVVWITPADLSKIKFANIKTSKRKISNSGLKSSSANLIPKGSIVLSSRAPIGYFAVPSVDFSTNQGCKSIKLYPEQDAYFHYYNLLFNVDKFKSKGEGTTFAEISKKEIEKIEIEIPSLPHQQKIAKILSTCDAVIEKTEAAIEKYKALKQGMMHDLFTRGIDVETGKLRPSPQDAPELYKNSVLGMIPKEWEVKRLEDLANLIDGDRGVNYPSEGSFSEEGYCLFLSAKNVTKNGFQFLERQFISQEIDTKMNNGKLQLNDILITTRGTVGNIAIYDSDFEYKNIRINSGMLIIRKTNCQLDNLYFYHFFKSHFFKSQLDRVLSGSAQPQITVKNMNEFVVPFLYSLDEQKEITKRLNTIDQK